MFGNAKKLDTDKQRFHYSTRIQSGDGKSDFGENPLGFIVIDDLDGSPAPH